MKLRRKATQRVVVGGGIFGCYSAIVLADRGYSVILVEQDTGLLQRASYVNQARLHTGLHYPRSILTARESLNHYQAFRSRFAPAVKEFEQIYAVAKFGSKTSGSDFSAFIERLGIDVDEVNPETWFHKGTVSRAFRVEEPAFDSQILSELLASEISERPGIQIIFGKSVIGGIIEEHRTILNLDDESSIETESVVLATYASTNSIRRALGLNPLPVLFELSEVLLGEMRPDLQNLGFTIMDGPFLSLMPFGHTGKVSLTSVGLTPVKTSQNEPCFSCQDSRDDCKPDHLKNCNSCPVRPISSIVHIKQQMRLFFKFAKAFRYTESLHTVKTILKSTEVDDARPTLVYKEPNYPLYTVLSGKISTIFDLDSELK